MISVDGDTSTNDTALVLANGMAENPVIEYGTEDYQTFKAHFTRSMNILQSRSQEMVKVQQHFLKSK